MNKRPIKTFRLEPKAIAKLPTPQLPPAEIVSKGALVLGCKRVHRLFTGEFKLLNIGLLDPNDHATVLEIAEALTGLRGRSALALIATYSITCADLVRLLESTYGLTVPTENQSVHALLEEYYKAL